MIDSVSDLRVNAGELFRLCMYVWIMIHRQLKITRLSEIMYNYKIF